MPKTTCTHCGATFQVAAEAVGRRARCGKCKQRFVVQDAADEQLPIGDDPFAVANAAAADPLADPLGIGDSGDSLGNPQRGWDLDGLEGAATADAADPQATGFGVEAAPAASPAMPPTPLQPAANVRDPAAANKASGRKGPSLLIVGLIGGGVLAVGGVLVLVIALAAWFALSSGSEGIVGLTRATGDGTIVAAARPPQYHEDNWVVAQPFPTGVDWKVTEDPAPRSSELQSKIVVGTETLRGETMVAFAAPESAKAAALRYERTKSPLDWTPIDLRRSTTGKPVSIRPFTASGGGNRQALALGPEGKRLAVVGNSRRRFDEPDTLLAEVYADDGQLIASLSEDLEKIPAVGKDTYGAGFADSNTLVVQAPGKLFGFDLESGSRTYVIEQSFVLPVVFSAGRQWFAGFDGEAFKFYATRDGTAGGTLPLPASWYDPERLYLDDHVRGRQPLVDLGFHPDGRRAVVTSFDKEGGLHIGLFDLTEGKVSEAFKLPFSETQEHMRTPPVWLEDRRLLFPSGPVVDLDLRTFLCSYKLGGWGRCMGRSPDGRAWRMMVVEPGTTAGPRAMSRERERLLVAATLPYPEDVQAYRQARDGFLWKPGASVRIEAEGKANSEQLQQLVDTVADAVAKEGFRIDPEAETVLHIEDLGIEDAEVLGDLIEYRGGGWGLFELLDGVGNGVRIKVQDSDGKPLMRIGDIGTSVEGTDAAAEEQARAKLREELSKRDFLPRMYLRNAAGERIGRIERNVTQGLPVGIDGIEEPTREPIDRTFDQYALPDERFSDGPSASTAP